jgi:hypothetical protein
LGTVGSSPWVYFSQVTVYASCGLFLIGGSRRDRRAALLGLFFLLIATSFSARVIETLALQLPGKAGASARTLGGLQVDAFMPLFLWLFARSFPRINLFGLRLRIVNLSVIASVISGAGLLGINLVLAIYPERPFAGLRMLAARDSHYYYWIPTCRTGYANGVRAMSRTEILQTSRVIACQEVSCFALEYFSLEERWVDACTDEYRVKQFINLGEI